MVLSSGYGQHWLHHWSKKAIQDQKEGTPNIHIPSFWTAATSEGNPKIPDPSLFDFASEDAEDDNTRLPTVAECAAHLELLEVFYHIRLKVLESTTMDAILGIKPEPQTVYRKTYLGDEQGHSQEEVMLRAKWPFYLALAATRFLRWAEVVEEELDGPRASNDNSLHLPPIGRLSHDITKMTY